jgi:hypothetical protein
MRRVSLDFHDRSRSCRTGRRVVAPQEREALKRLYPNAQVLTLSGFDHFTAALPPESLTSAIVNFPAT